MGVLLRLSWPQRLLLVEASVMLVAAAQAIACVSFRSLAGHLGVPMQESADDGDVRNAESIRAVEWAVHVAARQLPWASSCFSRAITAKIMLRRRGIASTLYLGVTLQNGTINAHAWLRSGSAILTGGESSNEFATVCWFT
ncbi:MAG: lasso peptide biosynthesis B2 protein [Thioalkalivibrio sp.]|nr:lasso peptide biosynthesis B2 protein [Thioalkalivibrio sp.]